MVPLVPSKIPLRDISRSSCKNCTKKLLEEFLKKYPKQTLQNSPMESLEELHGNSWRVLAEILENILEGFLNETSCTNSDIQNLRRIFQSIFYKTFKEIPEKISGESSTTLEVDSIKVFEKKILKEPIEEILIETLKEFLKGPY